VRDTFYLPFINLQKWCIIWFWLSNDHFFSFVSLLTFCCFATIWSILQFFSFMAEEIPFPRFSVRVQPLLSHALKVGIIISLLMLTLLRIARDRRDADRHLFDSIQRRLWCVTLQWLTNHWLTSFVHTNLYYNTSRWPETADDIERMVPPPQWDIMFPGISSIALTLYAYAAVHASVIKDKHGIRQNAVNKPISKGRKTNPNSNV